MNWRHVGRMFDIGRSTKFRIQQRDDTCTVHVAIYSVKTETLRPSVVLLIKYFNHRKLLIVRKFVYTVCALTDLSDRNYRDVYTYLNACTTDVNSKVPVLY